MNQNHPPVPQPRTPADDLIPLADVAEVFGLPRPFVPSLAENGSLGRVVTVAGVAHVHRSAVEALQAPALRLRQQCSEIAERNMALGRGAVFLSPAQHDLVVRALDLA